VIDVEEGALGTLEEDLLPALQGAVQVDDRVLTKGASFSAAAA
jgi:hypothetical protein